MTSKLTIVTVATALCLTAGLASTSEARSLTSKQVAGNIRSKTAQATTRSNYGSFNQIGSSNEDDRRPRPMAQPGAW
jgi:hypothetical protein